MDETARAFRCEAHQLRELFHLLQAEAYQIAGPYLQQGALAFGFLERFEQIPVGYQDTQGPGHYRLKKSASEAFFSYAAGPHSIKTVLHPARRKLWEAQRHEDASLNFHAAPQPDQAIALFGVRACDIQALHILDQVFLDAGYRDAHYAALREKLLIVAVNCAAPSELCFCHAMGLGPVPQHIDLQLTEVCNDTVHFFLIRAGSEKGRAIVEAWRPEVAAPHEEAAADEVVLQGQARLKKTFNTKDLPEILRSNPLHPRWDEVADRCLSCGNCTMVCPTCFCTTTEDITGLQGDHTERWLHWDSCFTADFSYIHGGQVRKTTASRYRQWLTHKLSTWHDQFGSSGCVGCGRCIAWCPVGIDLTEEATAIRGPL